MNSNITAKERNLLKGAIRRVFSRSEMRQKVINAAVVEHKDVTRPRVTKWVVCQECKQPTAKYQAEVDHVLPIIPVDQTLEHMSWDTVINRIWCDEKNLQVLCPLCHDVKTKAERKLRTEYKRKLKNVKQRKTTKKPASSNRKRNSSRTHVKRAVPKA